jgi:glycosyltransferase involved in cell wall biosynthesis
MPGPILLDATPLGGGHALRGVGTALRGLLHGLAGLESGERPEVVVRWSQPPPPGFVYHRVPWPEWRFYRVPDPWPGAVTERAVRRLEPRLFHATQPALMPEGLTTVATCHDLIPAAYPRDYLEGAGRAAEARMYTRYLERLRAARLVMTPSQETADDVVRLAGVDPSRVRVIPWAAPLPIPQAGEVPEGDYVLFSGALEPHKNARLAVAAVAQASPGVRLAMTGPWSSRRVDRLRRFARAVDAEHRVVWLGYVPAERLAALRTRALAVVIPSWKEGFGLPVLEAMAAGTPVIASDTPSLREAGGDAARYLPLGDPRLWGRAISELAGNPAERERLGRAGREQAGRFSWETTAELTMAAYRDALS